MTLKEFIVYWNRHRLSKRYLGASEPRKIKLLEDWGLSEYKEEADRQSWIDTIHRDYNEEEYKKPPPKNIQEIKERLEDFNVYLQGFQLRDYERLVHIGPHLTMLTLRCVREGIKRESLLRELFGEDASKFWGQSRDLSDKGGVK